MCFPDHERHTVKGSCMEFAYFLQVRYKSQNIDDTTRERRYDKWFAQNHEFNDDGTLSRMTTSNNPCKNHHDPGNMHYVIFTKPVDPLTNEYYTKKPTTYDIGSTFDPSMPLRSNTDLDNLKLSMTTDLGDSLLIPLQRIFNSLACVRILKSTMLGGLVAKGIISTAIPLHEQLQCALSS
ncbi:hypothetical protein Tco_1175034 [Tanacetum coccineum]